MHDAGSSQWQEPTQNDRELSELDGHAEREDGRQALPGR